MLDYNYFKNNINAEVIEQEFIEWTFEADEYFALGSKFRHKGKSIYISSNTSLNIGIQSGISMSAGTVFISGSNKVVVSKSKGGVISLEGHLYNEASVVYENGSCRELLHHLLMMFLI